MLMYVGINKYLNRELKNKNIVSNSVRRHRLASLISKKISVVPTTETSFKIASD